MRKCTKCERDLPLEEFGKSKNGPGGLNYWCKECVRDNARNHRARQVADLGRDGYLEKRREYYKEKHDKIQEKRKVRQELRREHFTVQSLKWQAENKRKVKTSKKKYRENNNEKVLAYSRDYHATHKKERNARLRTRKKGDPAFKLRERLRSTFADKIRKSIEEQPSQKTTRRPHSVMALVGCTVPELMQHLESQFDEGMSWGNWGRGAECWHIDHIRPIASFDLFDEDDLKQCWHYTNLQPLWSTENLKKGPRIQQTESARIICQTESAPRHPREFRGGKA